MNENDIIKELKQLDNNVNEVIIPLLKDTIEDYRKIVFKTLMVIALLIICLFGISWYSIYKYNDFLKNIEVNSEYTQDFDTGENGDIIDAKIQNSK